MNNNNLEIERRFILRGNSSVDPDEVYEIFQKYADNGWRYRRQQSGDVIKYFKTRKTVVGSGVNEEEEYEITQDEFVNNCGVALKGISKTRSVYHHEGLRFEVDSFHDLQLVIMEVELDDIAQGVSFPQQLRELIIYEITGIKEFSNGSLASAKYLRHF